MYAFWVISSQEIVPVVKRKYPSHPALPHKSGVECENDHGALPSGSRAAQSMRAHDRTMRVDKKKRILQLKWFSFLFYTNYYCFSTGVVLTRVPIPRTHFTQSALYYSAGVAVMMYGDLPRLYVRVAVLKS